MRHYAITWNSELSDLKVYCAPELATLEAAVAAETEGRSALFTDDADGLRRHNGASLRKFYNELAARSGVAPVKKFEDKATACRRLFSRIEENAVLVTEAEVPAAKTADDVEENAQMAKTKVKKERKSRGDVGKPAKPVSEFKQLRAGTKRAEVLKLMDGTRTLEQVSKQAQLEPSRVLAHCYCTWRDCGIGYAVEDGKLTAKYPGQRGYSDAVKD